MSPLQPELQGVFYCPKIMAKKDAYYFPHYCNARHDRKIKRVIKDLGVEGYGIYFMLLEVLREQTDFKYPVSDIDLLADEFGTSEPKIKTVISNYDLFQIDDQQMFFSIKQIYYLQPYLEATERARNAANLRWGKVLDANALQMQSDSNTDAMQGKESKVKKSKVKEFIPPTIEEFKQYFKENGFMITVAERAWRGYHEANWHDAGGKPVLNWKQKCQNVWFEDKNKEQTQVLTFSHRRNDSGDKY